MLYSYRNLRNENIDIEGNNNTVSLEEAAEDEAEWGRNCTKYICYMYGVHSCGKPSEFRTTEVFTALKRFIELREKKEKEEDAKAKLESRRYVCNVVIVLMRW